MEPKSIGEIILGVQLMNGEWLKHLDIYLQKQQPVVVCSLSITYVVLNSFCHW